MHRNHISGAIIPSVSFLLKWNICGENLRAETALHLLGCLWDAEKFLHYRPIDLFFKSTDFGKKIGWVDSRAQDSESQGSVLSFRLTCWHYPVLQIDMHNINGSVSLFLGYLLTRQKLESDGRREPQLKAWFHQRAPWPCLWDIFLINE